MLFRYSHKNSAILCKSIKPFSFSVIHRYSNNIPRIAAQAVNKVIIIYHFTASVSVWFITSFYHNANKKDSRLTALIILCICTYLYLECHCDLFHDHVIQHFPDSFSKSCFIKCFHLFRQCHARLVQTAAFGDLHMGRKILFLPHPCRKRNDRNNRGMLICLIVAYHQCRTDTALLASIFFSKIHIINISTLTHKNLLSEDKGFHLSVPQFILFIQFLQCCFSVFCYHRMAHMVSFHHDVPCHVLIQKIRDNASMSFIQSVHCMLEKIQFFLQELISVKKETVPLVILPFHCSLILDCYVCCFIGKSAGLHPFPFLVGVKHGIDHVLFAHSLKLTELELSHGQFLFHILIFLHHYFCRHPSYLQSLPLLLLSLHSV
nr:MAG TPA: hypothetical protein [Caudoviricetes sp.]